jgi:ketosteroid isomerase-like protein
MTPSANIVRNFCAKLSAGDASGKPVDAAYAHVWTVREGRIQRFRQYIDALAVAEARS